MNMEDEAPAVRALAERLAALPFPEAETLAASVVDRFHAPERAGAGRRSPRRPGRRRLLQVTLAAVALIATVLVGSAMSPAIGNAPVINPVAARLLGILGLSPAKDRSVVPLTGGSTSANRTISLVAGYADSTQTLVVVRVSSNLQPVDATLTDASGTALRGDGSIGGGQDHVILDFGPLSRPQPGGNPLTLHVTRMLDYGGGKGADGKFKQVIGDWTLRFSLPYESNGLPVPAPGRLGRVTVTFTAVAASPGSIHLRFVTTGATMNELFELQTRPCASGVACVPEIVGTPGRAPFRYELLDPSGRPMGDMVNSNQGGKGDAQAVQDTTIGWDTLYSRAGPGTYRIVMTWNGSRVEREVHVP
jgi:hypothetical protein